MPERSSEASELGRRAHSIAERILKGELNETQDPNVRIYIDFVRNRLKLLEQDGGVLHIEQRVDYSHIAPQGFGTCDAVIVGNYNLEIIDFKNGRYPVETVDNCQLILYLAGAVKTFDFKGEKLHATIVQPKVSKVPETWSINIYQLNQMLENIKPIAEIAYQGKGEFAAGDHCSMCRFKDKCPEYDKYFKQKYDVWE